MTHRQTNVTGFIMQLFCNSSFAFEGVEVHLFIFFFQVVKAHNTTYRHLSQLQHLNHFTMPSQIESETAAITLRNGSKIVPRAAQRADREIIQKFRNDCGWDEDKVDDWFDMTENGERLQYLFADEENNTWAMIALDLEV